MLKVIHILGSEPHESVQRSIYDESAFMLKHGIDVRFIYDPSVLETNEKAFIDELRTLGALMYKLPYLQDERRSEQNRKKSNSHVNKNNARIKKDDGRFIKDKYEKRLSSFGAAMILREICAKYEIDVVHTHTEPAFRLACSARFLGAQVAHIFTSHAVTTRTPAENLFVRIMTLWCDEIIAVDNYTAGVLLDRMIRASKIKRVNYGIDLNKWKNFENPIDGGKHIGDDFTVLMIADSDDLKKDDVFDSFAEIILRLAHDFNPTLAKRRNLRFIISANSANGIKYPQELIHNLDLDADVELKNLPTQTEDAAATRLSVYRRSDLCLFYSENRFFPYPAAEAIAMGVPTVTNDFTFFLNLSVDILPETPSNSEAAKRRKKLKHLKPVKVIYKNGYNGIGKNADYGPDEEADTGENANAAVNEDAGIKSILSYSHIDFGKPEAVAQRMLTLINDSSFRGDFISAEYQTVRERYNIEDMLIGIYDSYVRGFRVN